jgi:chromosomal replication initiator protein
LVILPPATRAGTSPQQFNTWIKALRLEDGDESNRDLKLVAPNRFVLQWVRERYLRRLEDMAKQFFAEPVQISINLPEPSEIERLDVTTALRSAAKKDIADSEPQLPFLPFHQPAPMRYTRKPVSTRHLPSTRWLPVAPTTWLAPLPIKWH